MHHTRVPDNMTEAYSFITTQTYVYFGGTNKLTSLVYHLIRREIITHKKRERDPTANNAPLQSLNLFN